MINFHKTFPRMCAVILLTSILTSVLSACGLAQGVGLPGNSASSGAPSGPQVTATLPLPTLDINRASPTPQVTVDPFKTYSDQQLNVRFSYPSSWQEKSKGRLEGPDGYAWLELRSNDGAGPGAVCQSEANRGKPAQYGAYPQIIDMQVTQAADGAEGSLPAAAACLILPSADQPAARSGEALYLLWYPDALRPKALLALHADQAHIADIAKSLHLTGSVAEPASVACEVQAQDAPAPLRQNGLRIDAFPVARAVGQPSGCVLSQEAEAFNEVVANGPASARAQQMIGSQWRNDSLTRANTSLAPFGFRLRPYDKYYAIYKNGVTVKTKLNWVGPLTENASKTDFILPVMDSYNSQIYLLRPDGIHELGDWNILTSDRVFPVFVGDDLITPTYDYERYERPVNQPALLTVKKNDQLIDTFSVNQSTADGGPARGLWSWNGHWVLELPGLVIQDGQSLNDSLGYSEMFTWRLIKNKPFYFFRKDGQIHLSFDGQELPVTYDAVIHKPDCCTSELLQMQLFENGLTFYARQGNAWYYVVVEAEAR